MLLLGSSAGAVCWFEASLSGTRPGWGAGDPWPLRDGLGLLPGSACAHYAADGARRRPAYTRLVAQGLPDGLPDGLAVDDAAALCFEGTALAEVVTAQPGHRPTASAATRSTPGASRRRRSRRGPCRSLPSGRATAPPPATRPTAPVRYRSTAGYHLAAGAAVPSAVGTR